MIEFSKRCIRMEITRTKQLPPCQTKYIVSDKKKTEAENASQTTGMKKSTCRYRITVQP